MTLKFHLKTNEILAFEIDMDQCEFLLDESKVNKSIAIKNELLDSATFKATWQGLADLDVELIDKLVCEHDDLFVKEITNIEGIAYQFIF